jgi:DNA polymerase III epsilon subunit-like protein
MHHLFEFQVQSVPDLQLGKTIVFFDLETTGVDVNTDRIVELAMVKILPDQTVQQPLQAPYCACQRVHQVTSVIE